jgi:MFS family permease
MYVPSLITGILLDRFGKVPVMMAGTVVLVVALCIGYVDQTYFHYMLTLVLLGVGWNFMYVGATTTLTVTYRANERFRAQAVNEFSVFGLAALGSLLAGTVIHTLGWNWLILMPVPVLLIVLAGLYGVRKNSLLAVTPSLKDLANEKPV